MLRDAERFKKNAEPQRAQSDAGETFTIGRVGMDTLTTISELAQRLRRKEISPVEVTRACLDRIEKEKEESRAQRVHHGNGRVGAGRSACSGRGNTAWAVARAAAWRSHRAEGLDRHGGGAHHGS